MRKNLLFIIVLLSSAFVFNSHGQDIPARDFYNKGIEESKKGNLDAAIAEYTNH